jgi:hypothetical protein
LSRIDELRRKLGKLGGPSVNRQLDELYRELIEDLHEIIFPMPLAT